MSEQSSAPEKLEQACLNEKPNREKMQEDRHELRAFSCGKIVHSKYETG